MLMNSKISKALCISLTSVALCSGAEADEVSDAFLHMDVALTDLASTINSQGPVFIGEGISITSSLYVNKDRNPVYTTIFRVMHKLPPYDHETIAFMKNERAQRMCSDRAFSIFFELGLKVYEIYYSGVDGIALGDYVIQFSDCKQP